MGPFLPSLVLMAGAAVQAPPAAADAGSDYVRFELLRRRDRFEADGHHTRTLEVRILLRTAAAVAEAGQIALPYVDGYGDVAFEDVVIEKPDGRRVEVRGGLLEDLNPFGVGAAVPADVRVKKLTIPGLEPGDRLSYRVVGRQKPLSPGHVFGEMKFGPVTGDPLQVYELDLPRDGGIRVRIREGLGATWETVPAAPDRFVRRLGLKVGRPGLGQARLTDVFQAWAEPDVTVTSFSSWDEIARWWWSVSRDRLEPVPSVAAEATSLIAGKATPRERMEGLHRFVAGRIRYLSVSFGLGRMQPRPAAAVLSDRYGDCKDKHALLAALASSVGIDVRPVLIDSVRADLRDDVPSPLQFDHMISLVRLGPEASDWLWLDATNPFGPPGYLQPDLRDKRALLIEPSGEGRIVRTPVEPPFVPRTEVEVKGTLAPDGVLRARVVWRLRSDDEVHFRSLFAATEESGRAQAVRASLAWDWEGATVSNVVTSEPPDVTDPFRVEFDVERPPPTAPRHQSLWVPLPHSGLPQPDAAADAAALEIAPREFVARAEIELPEGGSARAPLSITLERPFGRFESAYSVEGRRVTLARTLRLSRRSVSADEARSYEAFRKAIDADRQQSFSVTGAFVAAPTDSAPVLHAEGMYQFQKKDYAQAVEYLRKTTEADPKFKDGFLDLGRALNEAGRTEEALGAFTRQIEIDPFHESAYEWRAYVLERLHRWDEAERDLLKQIEVTPFKAWSYEKLAQRRMAQRRFRDAAEYYSRAAAVEPKEPKRWVDLAWAHGKEGRAEEARTALDRARALFLPDWLKVRAGLVHDAIGDPRKAGELGASGIPTIAERLAGLTVESFGEGDVYWVERLSEAWYLVGAAARADGDDARAERYLDAAWKLTLLPQAAWALGDLREKQGRLAEAVDLWSMASFVPAAEGRLPEDRQGRIEAACRRLGEAPPSVPPEYAKLPPEAQALLRRNSRQIAAAKTFLQLRHVRLGEAVHGDMREPVLLLTRADGRVERVRALSPEHAADVDRQLAEAGPLRLDVLSPEDRGFKVVRRGELACSRTRCSIILGLPAVDPQSGVVQFDSEADIEVEGETGSQ